MQVANGVQLAEMAAGFALHERSPEIRILRFELSRNDLRAQAQHGRKNARGDSDRDPQAEAIGFVEKRKTNQE